jgi:hypothetical protein
MTKPYFRQVPNFEYVSRDSDAKNISDYVPVKNLFKRGKLREDIFGNLAFFEKYSIIGDERPDNVAFNFYGDETLDWVILLSNNILNIQDEWPMTQALFDKVMLEKYGSYENLYSGTHHYETEEVKNSLGVTIVPAGIQVDEDFFTEYNDNGEIVYRQDVVTPITNYEFERRIEEEKRNIFVLKSRYLNVVFNDMEDLMTYKKGGDQYVTDTLKRGDNIRLFY